jgi:hypothetical protein
MHPSFSKIFDILIIAQILSGATTISIFRQKFSPELFRAKNKNSITTGKELNGT